MNEHLKVAITALDYLTLVSDLAIDYDGYKDPKNLMKLIDEMAEYTRKAIAILVEKGIDV